MVGNLGIARGFLPFLEAQWKTHGDTFQIQAAGARSVVVCHPDAIQRVLLTNRQNYIKGPCYDVARRIFGDGLIVLEGERWRQRRALAQPSFHRHALERLTTIMAESGTRFFDRLLAEVAGPTVLDIHRKMVRLTLDVAVNALFGRGTLESNNVSYQMLGDALCVFSEGSNGIPLPAWLPTPRNLKFQRTKRALHEKVFEIIRGARGLNAEGTLLSMLLAARDEHGAALSDDELRDEVLTLFIAGHETTALTMSWMFFLLENQRPVVARMRDEVDRVLGGRTPTFEDLHELRYVRQVIDESMRLRPPAPLVARDALADDELGNFHVPAGMPIIQLIWAAHRHPDFWPDPLRFDPERFAPAALKGRHVASFLPFSLGPRVCIGNAFSLLETTLLTAQLMQRFDFETLPCRDVKPVAMGSVRPSRPIHVRLVRRRL